MLNGTEAPPEKHRPTGPVPRTAVQVLDLPPLPEAANLVDVVFSGSQPTFIERSGLTNAPLAA